MTDKVITTPTKHGRGHDDYRFRDLEDGCDKVEDPNIDYTNEDLIRRREILELELREEKATTQKTMAWMALWGIFIFTALLFTPIFPDSRIEALGDILGLFYIALAGVVGAFMGVTAWMSRR